MIGFIRRLIIATAEWTSILVIVVGTYVGGLMGQAAWGAGQTTFIVGAVLAFIVAATVTAALFCLIEIAQNTRRT